MRIPDREQQEQDRRAAAKAEKFYQQQLRADVQQVMNLEAGRRILWLFMEQMNVDGSAFATNAMQQSHAIGMQDAARWWLNAVRAYCPEKEAQIRKDGLAMARAQPPETEDDET